MKRREFLEVTAAGAGATRLAAPFAGVRVPPSDTVRFGMIGVGMQGSGLLGDAIALPGVTCAAAADLRRPDPSIPTPILPKRKASLRGSRYPEHGMIGG